MEAQLLVDHFQQAVFKLLPGFENSQEKIGLAVSGGPDSLALLLLAHNVFPDRISVATVDHGLRPESQSEAQFVASICSKHGISHRILIPSVPIRGSIQTVARKVRYGLLNDWLETNDIAYLATGHHADDQLETLMMRVLRGSGIDGMSGVRAKRGHIIRPLLHISKQSLIEFVEFNEISAIDDPSNSDQNFDRVRVRNALRNLEGFDIGLASKSAESLDDARTAIAWMVNELSKKHILRNEDGCELTIGEFPHEIVRRLVLKCLHICDPALSPRGEQLENCISSLKARQTTMLGDILCQGGDNWRFSPAPTRRNS